MELFCEYTIFGGTSEGDATNDDGRQAWYCLWTPIPSPRTWRMGISPTSSCDILHELIHERFACYCTTGTFDREMSEIELIRFIEAQLIQYFENTAPTAEAQPDSLFSENDLKSLR